MPAVITQTSALSQLASAAAAPELVLQQGTVIDARVLAVSDGLARILIAGTVIEALTQVPLQPGADLKLAVTQMADGVRLAIVPQAATAQAPTGVPAQASGSAAAPATSAASNSSVAAQAPLPRVAAASLASASPEAAAISQVVQAAAPRQASLAPLFANLPVIVASKGVPQQVASAAAELLATRPPLDAGLTAGDLRQAFQKSGLFLEATLARGAAPAGPPDLKAALVVFKQVLTGWLGQPAPAAPSLPAAQAQVAIAQPPGAPQSPASVAAQPAGAPAALSSSTSLASGLPQNLAPGPAPAAAAGSSAPAFPNPVEGSAEGQAHAPASAPPIPARPLAELSGETVRATQAAVRDAAALPREPALRTIDDPIARPPAHPASPAIVTRQSSEPAPPFRGAVPSAQPIASPSLAPDASPASMGRELLDQTDAALARQTLLQVASLPDRPEPGGANQTTQPRWSFEIPFATPQGTAVAQFEIERDGDNDVEGAAPSRIWRARFTLDVEPAGPVHALVSLVGDKTAVRLWAERPDTAAQLRAGANALSLALRQAELEPGDILVGEGAPAQPRMRAGRFLDRAT